MSSSVSNVYHLSSVTLYGLSRDFLKFHNFVLHIPHKYYLYCDQVVALLYFL